MTASGWKERKTTIELLWNGIATKGSEGTRRMYWRIFELLSNNERLSRQELIKILDETEEYSVQMKNFDRIMKKLKDEQLIRVDKEQIITNMPNKSRIYYRLNKGLVHRAVHNGNFLLRVQCRNDDPPNPKNGEIWLRTDL